MTGEAMTMKFDYIVVGAGPAGCVVANRLTEDPRVSVCLIEAGPPDTHAFIKMPAGFIKTLENPNLTWRFETMPTSRTNNRALVIKQGRVLGGSSAVNGMVYTRGLPSDFDRWASLGNRGWAFADVLPYFKKSEKWFGSNPEGLRGDSGPLGITPNDWRNDICDAFIDNAIAMGFQHNADYNGSTQEGVGYCQRFIERGRRTTAFGAYIKPVRGRSNLKVMTSTTVTKILLDGKTAVGVAVRRPKSTLPATISAAREVVLAAGTVNTARLLQVSGIADPNLLSKIGVPLAHPLPGVGEHLRDHYVIRTVARVRGGTTINELTQGRRLAMQVLRWVFRQPSVLGVSPSLINLFFRSDTNLVEPDLQGVFAPASYKIGAYGVLDTAPGISLGVWQHRPQSHGFVHATSDDIDVSPLVQPNYLDHEGDRNVLLAGLRFARQVLQGPVLKQYFVEELLPGSRIETDDAVLDYAYRYGASAGHLVGTARMGPSDDPMAVVGPDLLVHGLSSLRVIDASVMPTLPSANTMATVLMIGEKAAELMRARTDPNGGRLRGTGWAS